MRIKLSQDEVERRLKVLVELQADLDQASASIDGLAAARHELALVLFVSRLRDEGRLQ